MRSRLTLPVGAALFFLIFIYMVHRSAPIHTFTPDQPSYNASSSQEPWEKPSESEPQRGSASPRPVANPEIHPIEQLIDSEQQRFEEVRSRQSKTLKEAVREYRRRYQMPPPPNFDKWFEFASKHKVQLIDEFDTIYDLITPFWGLKPKTVRERAKEALGGNNFLLGVAIRDGEIAHMDGAEEWQRNATQGMIGKFAKFLPDMDLAFNIHDEPRVMVPFDDMSRLISRAKTINMPAAFSNHKPANDFSATSAEIKEGMKFEETKITRFNVYAKQPTWATSRMSCPPNSPTRALEEDEQIDYVSEYGYSDLGFIFNTSAMSDICLSPSVGANHGFFDAPNAYSVVHDLFPIFSQSKVSTYADLTYPSPWYWYNKVPYDEQLDKPWDEKTGQLYWRGSTTGGFSRRGGWRRHHRQRFVQKINGPDEVQVLSKDSSNPDWKTKSVPRGEFSDLIDVKFSHVGQCDPGDCEAQINFFNPVEHTEQQDAWQYKYLLDMDGNAFSGRFYAFLRSRSLVFKMGLFREWHYEWLRPWLHYVPLSLRGDDWLEATRFFVEEEKGQALGQAIAKESRDWAAKVVRKEDMEAWFFRLLLEYARVIDDNREIIGYDPSSSSKKLPA